MVLGVIMMIPGFSFLDVSIMEARNLITAREMLFDDHWLLTTMNGEPRYQKPPLPTWLTAISMSVFGVSKIIWLRLPGILMVGFIGVFSHKLSKTLGMGTVQSITNAMIAITSFYIIAIVIEGPWDIFAHGFMCFGIYFLFLTFNNSGYDLKKVLLSALFIGASILSKGPISLYALFIPFLIAYGLSFKYERGNKSFGKILIALFIGVLIGGWWYLYVRLNDPMSFQQMASKETSNWSSYNVRPFYYYWSFFTQSGIWTVPAFMALLYPYMKSRVKDLKAYRFSLLWTIIAVILLSIIPEKKSRYLMPVLIPMALNTGFYIQFIRESLFEFRKKWEVLPVYLYWGLLGLIGILFSLAAYFIFGDIPDISWWYPGIVSIVLFVLGLMIMQSLLKKKTEGLVNLGIVFALATVILIAPLARFLEDGNYKPISNLNQELSDKGMTLYQIEDVSPELIWQYGQSIPRLKSEDHMSWPGESSFYVLYGSKDLSGITTSGFNAEYIRSYDLNRTEKGNGTYRDRLKTHLFKFSLK
ncbi:MAG: glycosyltransferase [Flavobacteriaceae bacterium]|nr:glycosyltransferase [Flavobacteriaceae bacterium]